MRLYILFFWIDENSFTARPVLLTFFLAIYAKINGKHSRAKQWQLVSAPLGISRGNWKESWQLESSEGPLPHASTRWLPSVTSAGSLIPRPEGLLGFLTVWWLAMNGEHPKREPGRSPLWLTALRNLASGAMQHHFCQNLLLQGISLDSAIQWEKCQRIWEHVLKPQQWCLGVHLFPFTMLCFLTVVRVARPQSGNMFFSLGKFDWCEIFPYSIFYVISSQYAY